eukprot:scaffold213147_cov22-Tisochrysis_lutea.AAC.2
MELRHRRGGSGPTHRRLPRCALRRRHHRHRHLAEAFGNGSRVRRVCVGHAGGRSCGRQVGLCARRREVRLGDAVEAVVDGACACCPYCILCARPVGHPLPERLVGVAAEAHH